MVVALGPGKFYGSSLPRPYIYTEQKFNVDRVDPPMTIMEPFLSWANEAHWSMGGLNHKRLRLQGRIEGNVKKLRSEKEKQHKQRIKRIRDTPSPIQKETVPVSNSPGLAAPVKPIKRRKLALVDDVDEEVPVENESETLVRKGDRRPRRGPVRKLGDDFDRVATVKTVEEIEKQVSTTEAAVKIKEVGLKKKKLQKGGKKINSSAAKKSPTLRTSTRLNVVRFED